MIQYNEFEFESCSDTDCEGSKLLSYDSIAPNTYTEFFGALRTLFGEPLFEDINIESAFSYTIKAKHLKKEIYLDAYCGPTGPAIGGNSAIEGTYDAARALIELLKITPLTDFDYIGYSLDYCVKISFGSKCGQTYYEEEDMDYDEIMELLGISKEGEYC